MICTIQSFLPVFLSFMPYKTSQSPKWLAIAYFFVYKYISNIYFWSRLRNMGKYGPVWDSTLVQYAIWLLRAKSMTSYSKLHQRVRSAVDSGRQPRWAPGICTQRPCSTCWPLLAKRQPRCCEAVNQSQARPEIFSQIIICLLFCM